MRLKDGSELSAEQIEELNAHGPYSMAVWRSGGVSVGNEEGLTGRSAYFVKLIREAILKNFTIEQLKSFSILDIGSNDGWVLHQLSDLPFAKMVGIEPREKNIAKGRKVREILKLENAVDYRVGDIESLGAEEFDIVICAGVLYHVESIPVALRNIRNVCKKMVFIESRCLSDGHLTPDLMAEVEMRDLVYQFKEKQCGITVQKYESGYHDGSAKSATIVNVPSVSSLLMNLWLLGFENIDVVADPETYRSLVWQDKRPLSGVCITATVHQQPDVMVNEESKWIDEYEKGLEREILPRTLVEPFYRLLVLNDLSFTLTENLKKIHEYLLSNGENSDLIRDLLPTPNNGKYASEIVQNWRYSPCDKISLEFGKILKFEGKFDDALDVLKGITSKLNADWRAVYRSFNLISQIYQELGKTTEAEKYKELCLKSNYKFPVD
jgi:SAM-dependent methyltransferase